MDLIDRQLAIDVIKHVEVHFTVKSTVDFSAHKKAVNEIIDHILDAQEKALGELPSTEKTWDWTPCSERLPDSNGEYLVTIECEGFTCVDTDTYSCYGWKAYGIDSVGCVIAWMPLPKPYQEDKQ